MKSEKKPGGRSDEMRLELKYCERCGGLWLRPVAGGQIYCRNCAKEVAQLPPASTEPDSARTPNGPLWGEDCEVHENDESFGMGEAGGVA